jgi:formylglycine-generating enzyme required for sulfatase activity
LNALLSSDYEFSLPTEAQWEYACRASSTTAYGFGDSPEQLKDYAWYSENSGGNTHEVGTKKANLWGLYDMYGNVWEWCSDWYGTYISGSLTDPIGVSNGSDRVDRGGGWVDYAKYCRSANRDDSTPTVRGSYLGLRLSLVDKSK